jgi:hypothetical protein
MLLRPAPQKFNTFSTFNTFNTFDRVAANHRIEPPAVAMNRSSERPPSNHHKVHRKRERAEDDGSPRGRFRSAQ